MNSLDPLDDHIKRLVRLSKNTRYARRRLKAPTGRPPETVGQVRLAEIMYKEQPLVEVRFLVNGKTRHHHRTANWEEARYLAKKINAVLPASPSRDVMTAAPEPSGDALLREMLRMLGLLCAELRELREEIRTSRVRER